MSCLCFSHFILHILVLEQNTLTKPTVQSTHGGPAVQEINLIKSMMQILTEITS